MLQISNYCQNNKKPKAVLCLMKPVLSKSLILKGSLVNLDLKLCIALLLASVENTDRLIYFVSLTMTLCSYHIFMLLHKALLNAVRITQYTVVFHSLPWRNITYPEKIDK